MSHKSHTTLCAFLRRLQFAAPAACLLCFTFLFFGPYEVVAFNGPSLSYHHSDIIATLLIAAFITSLFLSIMLSLLSKKLFPFAVGTVFSTALCFYLQAGFFNGALGALTGDTIDWLALRSDMIVNAAVWLLVFIAVFALLHIKRPLFNSLVVYVSMLLLFMQTVPAVGIILGAYEETKRTERNDYSLQTTGIYEFSKADNVFVIVLDRLDYDYIESTLAIEPTLFDRFDGFIQYTNAISTYFRTRPALAHLLTGCEDLAYRTTPETYYKECWTYGGRDILQSLDDLDFRMDIYANIQDLFSDPKYAAQYISNLSNIEEKPLPHRILKRMVILSAYRFFPIAAKQPFFKSTSYYSEDVYASEPYSLNDSKHGAGFSGITAKETQPIFKFIHFNGTHAPYTLTRNGTYADYSTSVEDQLIGCIGLLNRAFDRMKELDIYENASIIITADHGNAVSDVSPLLKPTRIGLFYKPSGSSGTPIVHNSAPVSTQNIPATIIKAAGGDYSAYGRPLDEIAKDEELIRTAYKSTISPHHNEEAVVYTYHIHGDASDMDNWEMVDSFEIQKKHSF